MCGEEWSRSPRRGSCASLMLLFIALALLASGLACAGGTRTTAPASAGGGTSGDANLTPPVPPTTPGPGTSTSGTSLPPSSRFLFAGFADRIWAGRIDSSTGQVTPLPMSFTDGASIVSVTEDPQGRFLYAAQQASGASGATGIGVLAVNPATGALAKMQSLALPNVPDAIVASGTAVFALVNGAIQVFSVAANGLTAAPGSPFSVATVGTLAAITPDGRFLINVGGGQAAVFSVDPQTGTPVEIAGSPFSTDASGEQSVVASPDGKRLFILTAGDVSGNIAVMDVSAGGALSPHPQCARTSPATVGCFPPVVLGAVTPRQGTSAVPSMTIDSLGHSLYVLGAGASGGTRVIRMEVGVSGALGIISILAQDAGANSIALDAGGKFLFVGAGGQQQTLFTYNTGRVPEPLVSTTSGFTANSNLLAVP